MSKDRYLKKNRRKVPVWMIVTVTLAVLAIIAGVIILLGGQSDDKLPPETNASVQTQTGTPAASTAPTVPAETTVPVIPETTSPKETVAQTEPTEGTHETEAPTQGTQPETAPPPTIVIVQRAEAEYEKWLSAAMIVCVSMEYPDFELEGVYAASATALDDKFSSDGAYIVFSIDGERMAIHAKALEGERTDPGTMDISTEVIGFASFDRVDPASVDLSSMEELALEDLSELITQSLLISIYTR